MNRTKRIAIQGYPGAFHEIATRFYYPKVLNSSELKITGEVFLRIRQNLMALPGQKIEDLREVHSHPIAIIQCRPFFKKYPHIKLISMEDTALSAKRIREGALTGVGAIASSLAANRYEMDLLAEGIETNKKNFTRFLVIDKEVTPLMPAEINKVSICFSVPHKAGSLHKALQVLADHSANMTKVQSVPLIGEAWRYIFFIDFILEKYDDLATIMTQLKAFYERLGKLERRRLYDLSCKRRN